MVGFVYFSLIKFETLSYIVIIEEDRLDDEVGGLDYSVFKFVILLNKSRYRGPYLN